MGVRHNYHSHAHESNVQGTVDLKANEGEETGYGQALYPVPSADPNDPLQWSDMKKNTILAICAAYSFLSNSALLGPSVYIGIFVGEFQIDPNTSAGLINYANLAYGFGNLILVPLYHKIGRRPVMLASLLVYALSLIGCSQCTTYSALMGCRVLQGFSSGVCEALPVQLVNDVFFLHERGKKLGIYTACLCLGATGPLYAGYMLAGGYSWKLFFYVEFAFAMALFILAFIFVEESRFVRKTTPTTVSTPSTPTEDAKEATEPDTTEVDSADIPPRKTFAQTLSLWTGIDHEAQFFTMMLRSFTYFLVPSVFWVITTYGLYIGLGALTFNFVFPIKIVAPPYNWSQTNSGLLAIATILGYLLALPLTSTSDRLAARLTKKNNGIREAEMRLGALLIPMLIGPAGLIVFGMTAEKNLHWIGYFFGSAMTQWSAYFFFTFTLAYSVDSYSSNLSEMLIAMNLGKQAISFGMGFQLLNWILTDGYATVIAGIFCAVLLVNNLSVVPFMVFGKRIRVFYSKTWLAAFHQQTIVAGETH